LDDFRRNQSHLPLQKQAGFPLELPIDLSEALFSMRTAALPGTMAIENYNVGKPFQCRAQSSLTGLQIPVGAKQVFLLRGVQGEFSKSRKHT